MQNATDLVLVMGNYLNCIAMCGSVADWLACWTQAQKGLGSNRVGTLSGNSLRQIVHQAAKLVTALLRVAGVTAGGRK